MAPARRTARPIRMASCSGIPFGHGDDDPDAGSERFLDRGKRFQWRCHRDRRQRACCRYGVAAVGEHRHTGCFLCVQACGCAANDVGAVGEHQSGMGPTHAAGDALHDDGRGLRQPHEAPSPTPSRRLGGGGEGAPPTTPPTLSIASSISSVTNTLGALREDTPRLGGTTPNQPRHHRNTKVRGPLHPGREQVGELGQIRDAGEHAHQHGAQRRCPVIHSSTRITRAGLPRI